jgi:hypothetical protein
MRVKLNRRRSLVLSTCRNCGEGLDGDGYGMPERCPNALEADWWYSEPDSGPYYCEEEE